MNNHSIDDGKGGSAPRTPRAPRTVISIRNPIALPVQVTVVTILHGIVVAVHVCMITHTNLKERPMNGTVVGHINDSVPNVHGGVVGGTHVRSKWKMRGAVIDCCHFSLG